MIANIQKKYIFLLTKLEICIDYIPQSSNSNTIKDKVKKEFKERYFFSPRIDLKGGQLKGG